MKILFLHGWQSVSGGVKPTFLAQHGHEVVNPKLPDEDFTLAVKIAQEEFDKHQPDVVVGSSRGGAEEDHLKAAWLEINTRDVQEVKRRLVEFGVKEVEYPDKSRFYFQAPGGQVFRLAPDEGGI